MDSLDQFSATLNLFSEPIGEARLSTYVEASEKAIQGFMKNRSFTQEQRHLNPREAFFIWCSLWQNRMDGI